MTRKELENLLKIKYPNCSIDVYTEKDEDGWLADASAWVPVSHRDLRLEVRVQMFGRTKKEALQRAAKLFE